MKYRNKETGVILEPRSELVESQLQKDELFEEYDDSEQDSGSAGEKPVSRMNKVELMAKAEELGLTVSEGLTNEELKNIINVALGQ